VDGTRGPYEPAFISNALQTNTGYANYNAVQLSARHTSGRLEFDPSYTYARSMDLSSNFGEEVNPFNQALCYAISVFDIKHNFVVSYEYQLPNVQLFHPNRLTKGCSLSGITRFAKKQERTRSTSTRLYAESCAIGLSINSSNCKLAFRTSWQCLEHIVPERGDHTEIIPV